MTATTPFHAVLFDMDGVIIDSHDAVTHYWLTIAERHNITLTDALFKQHIYGCTFDTTFDKVFGTLTSEDRQAALDFLYEYENHHLVYKTMPGAIALLRGLRGRVPVALVTSGDRPKTSTVFAQLGLEELFQARVTLEDVTRGKPDPQCFRLGAERVNIPPERCIVFEDSRNGALAAMGAGCTVIGVQPPDNAQMLHDIGVRDVIRDFEGITVDNGTLILPGGARYALEKLNGTQMNADDAD